MSRIWDALQQIEQQRQENALDLIPERIQLTPRQRLAIEALLQTDSLADAARMTGVAEMTMRRWLSRPGFITAYYRAGREQLKQDGARLDAATETTIAKLRRAREMLAQLAQVAAEMRGLSPRPAAPEARAADGVARQSRNGKSAPPRAEDEAAGGR